jgi:hypothetical protein
MSYSKFVSIICATVLFACAFASDAAAQKGKSGGSRGPGRGPSVGRTQPSGPRTGGPRTGPSRVYPGTRYGGPRYGTPFRSYYYPYRYPYYRFPSFALGLAFGLGSPYYYGYGYPYYSSYYSYPYYSSYPYYGGYSYPYAYGGYAPAYGGYAPPPPAGYVGARGGTWGEIRIEGAPKDAQVYADGRLVGRAGDFDGPVHHLELEAGPHEIEIRMTGMPPMTYDVDVSPGQTMSIHVNVR